MRARVSSRLIVSAQVRGHVGGRVARVGVDSPGGGVPIGVGGGEEAGGGDGQGLRVGRDKVHLLLVGVVGAHVGQV